MEEFKELKTYLRDKYASHDERTDLYVYFIEREHNLLRRHGRFGMIVSNKFVRANYGKKIRDFLSKSANIDRIVDLAGLPVFRGATVRTIVVLTTKDGERRPLAYSPPIDVETLAGVQSGAKTLDEAVDPVAYDVAVEQISVDGWNFNGKHETKLLAKLRGIGTPLVQVAGGKICRGIVSGLTEAFVISRLERDAIVKANPKAAKILRPFLQGRDIRPYSIEPRDEFLIYTYHGIDMEPFPAVLEHLRPYKQQLQKRATKQAWYELQQPQLAYREIMERPKIVFPDIATTCRFAIDAQGRFGANTVYFLPVADPFLLGILNSRLAHFYFAQTCAALEGPGESYLRFFGQYLEGFPIKGNSNETPELAKLVDARSTSQSKLESARTPDATVRLERQIDVIDRQIDQLVYELYGLTGKEIALVEAAG
jgi:hypothetical protein